MGAAAWVPDIRRARTLLVEALLVDDHAERYVQAHRAVVWAADAAVLGRTGGRIPPETLDPWVVVARVVPGLAEWADYFIATEARRVAAARGRVVITEREADDLVREADLFCEAVVACLAVRSWGRTG